MKIRTIPVVVSVLGTRNTKDIVQGPLVEFEGGFSIHSMFTYSIMESSGSGIDGDLGTCPSMMCTFYFINRS